MHANIKMCYASHTKTLKQITFKYEFSLKIEICVFRVLLLRFEQL